MVLLKKKVLKYGNPKHSENCKMETALRQKCNLLSVDLVKLDLFRQWLWVYGFRV